MKTCAPIAAALAALLAATACKEEKKAFRPVAAPTTPPPVVRAGGLERFRVEEAMSIEDISFMIRTSSSEAEILQEIIQRGFVNPLRPTEAEALKSMGASASFIAAIQDKRYVLTPAERVQYEERMQKHSQKKGLMTQRVISADRKELEKDFEERQRQFELQQQALNAAAEKERAQREREFAKQKLEKRRRYLEQEAKDVQNRMNQYRQWGYKEAEISRMNERLREVREELSNLKAP